MDKPADTRIGRNALVSGAIPRLARKVREGLIAAAILTGPTQGQAQETLPVLAEIGPWPVLSYPIAFAGRLWMVNSVKGRNHNSADVYSYHPGDGDLRYERHLFSQDAGQPAVAGGLLYWPFEDSRFSLGWGHFMVTDGVRWQYRTIPTARSFHTHAMTEAGGRLVAATSAWRAGLQASADGGATWRQVYDHPTPNRQVSRIIDLAGVRDLAIGYLIQRDRRQLLRLDGDSVEGLPGWPEDRSVFGLTATADRLYAGVREDRGIAIWTSDGRTSHRLSGPREGWRIRDLSTANGALWALSATAGGGQVWRSESGKDWRIIHEVVGGDPLDMAVVGGRIFVTGAGEDGRGILWGPKPDGMTATLTAARLEPSPQPSAEVDWAEAGRNLDALFADPASYGRHGADLRDAVYSYAAANPPPRFFADRLEGLLPDHPIDLIGGQVTVPAADLGRWILLWGMTVSGSGEVPKSLLSEPWSAPPNPSEKYFAAPPAAMWAAATIGQLNHDTIESLIRRLGRMDEPRWLHGDAVGALSALTDRGFGYDAGAWRAWWENPTNPG